MAETLLKKDFKERDINRIRNLVNKNFSASTASQIGYSKKEDDHIEGDVWQENDKFWTIKNGLKQSYTKLDSVKKTMRMPLSCPKCKRRMKGSLDKKMYSIHEECSMCVAEKESKMKIDGTYDNYVKSFINNNLETYLEDAEQFMFEFADSIASKYVTEQGDIEEMSGQINKQELIDKWKKELEDMRKTISNG